jgi:hypothetical protein
MKIKGLPLRLTKNLRKNKFTIGKAISGGVAKVAYQPTMLGS